MMLLFCFIDEGTEPHQAKWNSAVSTFNCEDFFFNLMNIYFKHLPKVVWSVFPEVLFT